jgi:molecular chaperone GrpE
MSEKEQKQENEEPKVQEEKQEKTELELKQEELDDITDRYKRVLAEFENFKKRSLKEREGLYNSVLADIILGMLPAMDNLENAMKAECKDENYKQGIELVYKQFKDFLEKHGVQEIPAVGETFDPSVHEAVSSVQDDTKGPQEIVQEYRKGYKIGSKVIRHSMVVVNA